jgi:hypothetical protein
MTYPVMSWGGSVPRDTICYFLVGFNDISRICFRAFPVHSLTKMLLLFWRIVQPSLGSKGHGLAQFNN